MTIIIDSDAHVVESPDLFTSRVASKHGDLVPHVKYRADVDEDWWFVGDSPVQNAVSSSVPLRASGEVRRRDDYEHEVFGGRFYDQHPSSYDPHERVKVMDANGIRAATTFPNLGATSPEIYRKVAQADLKFQLEMVGAYNDWILSWSQAEPGRFIPLGCLPYWDVQGAVHELERCAELGMKGVIMTGKPQNHGCPVLADRHWDIVWSAAEANHQSVSFHVAGGGMVESLNSDRMRALGNAAWMVYLVGAEFFHNAISAVDLLVSGILQRHPSLNFAIVETGTGWVPFALEALDEHYVRYRPWLTRQEMRQDELPSDLFRRQVFVNTWFERAHAEYPYDNVMFETDYPHPTCLIGEEIVDAIENRLGSLSPDQKEGVLWKNAMRCFNLSLEDVGLAESSSYTREGS